MKIVTKDIIKPFIKMRTPLLSHHYPKEIVLKLFERLVIRT